jgi:transposase
VLALTEELFGKVRKHFPSDFIRIYVLSVLKLLEKDLTTKRIGWAYERSALSLLLPEVYLSKNTVTEFVERLSLHRGGMVEFKREFQAPASGGLIFDGTSMLSTYKSNPYCEKGYSPGKKNKAQVRLVYAFETTTRKPVYFNVVPGSVSDMSAFVSSFSDLGLKNCVMVLDNGFFSDFNIKAMLGTEGMGFVLPLKGNTALVSAAHKPFISYKDVIGDNFTYHGRFVFYRELACKKYDGCKVFVYYDERRNKDLEKERLKKAQALHGGKIPAELVRKLHKECEMLGVTMLLTNNATGAEQTYLDYKARWAIEEMFDTMKNTLSFNMNHELRYETQMGWAFIEFLSLLMYFEIDEVLKEKGLYKNYSVGDLIFDLKAIEQSNCNADGKWALANLSKRRKELLDTLGVTLELITKSPDYAKEG